MFSPVNHMSADRRNDMAKVIEFYVSDFFHKKVKPVPPKQHGKVIEFPKAAKKSA